MHYQIRGDDNENVGQFEGNLAESDVLTKNQLFESRRFFRVDSIDSNRAVVREIAWPKDCTFKQTMSTVEKVQLA